MQIRIEDIKYRPERHVGQPESPEEELTWAVMDLVDELLVALAVTSLTGIRLPDEVLADLPAGSQAARRALTETGQLYVREVSRDLEELLGE